MKKLLLGLFDSAVGVFGLGMIMPSTVSAQAGPTIGNTFDSAVNNPAVVGGINVGGGTDVNQGGNLLAVIRNTINFVLGLLGLIALIMLLWAGFRMVMAGENEAQMESAKKTLKNAALGIALIAVSWFIVTFIFYVIGLVTS